jgi:hypothetical protein
MSETRPILGGAGQMEWRGDPGTASTRKRGALTKRRKREPSAKITLAEIEPPIWRLVLVPTEIRLDKLHDASGGDGLDELAPA